MLQKVKYEMIILLNEEFNDNELKISSFKYAKELKKLGGSEISVISRGKRNLAYPLKNTNKANFIEILFVLIPLTLPNLKKNLTLDNNVLRFEIFNKA